MSARATSAVAVPRKWLIALCALVIVPWLVVGGVYLSEASPTDTGDAAPSASGAIVRAGKGPWGELIVTPIVVSPPLEYVSIDEAPNQAPEWHFPGISPEMLESFLRAAGFSAEHIGRLRAAARPDGRSGLVVKPPLDVIRALEPAVRARLYRQLAHSSLNSDQAHAFRFLGSPDAWLAGSLISADTRRLVEPLIYRDGEFAYFADLDLLRPQIADAEELRRLKKTLSRQSTVLVSVAIRDGSDVGALTEYWGRGGRRTDIRPLLESVVAGGEDRSIDMAHLLPSFAREHLYRYPRIRALDLEKPVIANCLWSSLNFFNPEPDDRFLDVRTAIDTLKRDYYVIEHGFQLGDIVAFLDEQGDLFHVAVYLADDLAFTKNGTTPLAPWTVMSIAQIREYYELRSSEPRLIYHRRAGF